MLCNLPETRKLSPAWLLARRGLGVAHLSTLLRRLTLRSREELAASCLERLRAAELARLHWDIFGNIPYNGVLDTWGISYEIAGRIHHERFPLELQTMDEFTNSEENLLYYDIMPSGAGVYWEGQPISHLKDGIKPLVAIWILSGHLDFSEGDFAGDEMLQIVADWTDTINYADLPATENGWEFIWPMDDDGIALMIKRLEELPPPLDGLAPAVRCVAKNTGNPFIDIPETTHYYWEGHPWGYYSYPWTVEGVNELTELYEQVKSEIAQMALLVGWVGVSTNRLYQVISELFTIGQEVDKELRDAEKERRRPKTLVEIFTGQRPVPVSQQDDPERVEPAD